MKKFLIFVNPIKKAAVDFSKKVADFLEFHNQEACVLNEQFEIFKNYNNITYVSGEQLKNIDIAIVIGGDGTVIRALKKIKHYTIPVFGINFGRMGYLTQCEPENALSNLERVINSDFSVEERILLKGSIKDENGTDEFTVINEAALFRSNMLHAVNLNLKINDSYIHSFSCDGILVSTPTGSTAYNLSAGGPIITPTANNMVVTPVCSHGIFSRSIVTSAEDVVTLSIGENSISQGDMPTLVIDSIESFNCTKNCTITIKKSVYKVKIIKMDTDSFYRTLQKKLFKIG